jgi:hypothetical protein
VELVISAFWIGSLILPLLTLILGDFLAFLPLFLTSGGKNGVITFCVSPRIYCEQLDPDYVASVDEVLLSSGFFMNRSIIPRFVISSISFSA